MNHFVSPCSDVASRDSVALPRLSSLSTSSDALGLVRGLLVFGERAGSPCRLLWTQRRARS